MSFHCVGWVMFVKLVKHFGFIDTVCSNHMTEMITSAKKKSKIHNKSLTPILLVQLGSLSQVCKWHTYITCGCAMLTSQYSKLAHCISLHPLPCDLIFLQVYIWLYIEMPNVDLCPFFFPLFFNSPVIVS